MKISQFDYHFPPAQIALRPPKVRGQSRLLVLDRRAGSVTHRQYSDLIDYLNPGDIVVLNNTKVIKARLLTQNAAGHPRELLLIERHGKDAPGHQWRAVYRGKLVTGEALRLGTATITIKKLLPEGLVEIESTQDLLELTEQYGAVPLPPYMKRISNAEDITRYQTVFAQEAGSVAAPTASLNFTEVLKTKLEAKGIQIVYLTLHVGLGTFLPIRTDKLEDHQMHSEYFEIPVETVAAIQHAKAQGHKVTAIGTTVTRTLEYCANDILSGLTGLDGVQESNEQRTSRTDGTVSESHRQLTQQSAKSAVNLTGSASEMDSTASKFLTGEADIFIYPGYKFKVVDQLVTNFHAPRSTVLMLTAAFSGWDKLKVAYEEAIEKQYKLLSYGDSMLIL